MEITRETSATGAETMTVNMGPQHPATHGVLRVELEIDGETVVKATTHLGYLHRGMEKIAENKTYTQFIPYTDRMDYLAPLANNVAFAMAVEKLIDCTITPFPAGTTGQRQEMFARRALWQIGEDYAHGTGHGVGQFLGVHEGPHSLKNLVTPPLVTPPLNGSYTKPTLNVCFVWPTA